MIDEDAAGPWPWTNVQIAVQAADGDAALEGTSSTINPDTHIDQENVVGNGQVGHNMPLHSEVALCTAHSCGILCSYIVPP